MLKNKAISELEPSQLQSIVSDILQEALKQGASSAEADIGLNKGFSVTARVGEVESVEYNQDKAIGVTVYFGKRSGSSSLSDLRPDAIKAAVKAACNIARFTDEDPCSGLADKDELAFHYPKLEMAYPWDISVEHAIELACECEAKALALDKRISMSESVVLTTGQAWSLYGNTHGFFGAFSVTRHEMSCVLIAKKGDDMQRDYYYTTVSDPSQLDSISVIAKNAVERTVRRLNARRLTTRKVPVIFAAEEARSLLGHFVSAISGGNLYRKSSFLLDSLNTKVFPEHVRLEEHPFLPKGLGSSPFDDNGVATRENVFVDAGIVKQYVLGVYSARQLGMKTTGNAGGVHNLSITTSQNDLPALLKKMGTGLLVTELMGQGVNILTGDYSRGASGFWVENGEIQYPVEEITIAGNLRDMYANLVEVGCDVDRRGNILTGSILLSEMTVAGE
jgi:PmbA protein